MKQLVTLLVGTAITVAGIAQATVASAESQAYGDHEVINFSTMGSEYWSADQCDECAYNEEAGTYTISTSSSTIPANSSFLFNSASPYKYSNYANSKGAKRGKVNISFEYVLDETHCTTDNDTDLEVVLLNTTTGRIFTTTGRESIGTICAGIEERRQDEPDYSYGGDFTVYEHVSRRVVNKDLELQFTATSESGVPSPVTITDIRLSQVSPVGVQGKVLDTDGNPMANAKVELFRKKKRIRHTRTNAKGQYVFYPVPDQKRLRLKATHKEQKGNVKFRIGIDNNTKNVRQHVTIQ